MNMGQKAARVSMEFLRGVRLSKGISQAEMARKCGIQRHALCSLEKGKRFASLNMLMKICEAMDYEFQVVIKERER